MIGEEAPAPIRDAMSGGFVASAATANVIMQLARLPVGHAVAESRVHSGRVDLHPLKRLRTTLSYVVIAMYGSEAERGVMRREVGRAHRQVHSLPGDPVVYNAFDPELQLWVAACLYQGLRMGHEMLYGPPDEEVADAIYRHASRFGSTLQVDLSRWPADRTAFDEYWDSQVQGIEMDDVTRRYLLDLAGLAFLPAPVEMLFGPLHRFLTAGFLPPRFRDELGLAWGPRRQLAFEGITRTGAAFTRLMPPALRELPLNIYLWDVRRRIRAGAPVV